MTAGGGVGFLWWDAWPVLLAAPAVWLVATQRDRTRGRRLAEWIGPRVAELAGELDPIRRRTRRALFAAGLGLASIALLQPTWGERTSRAEPRATDIVVCLDVSRSMLARDVSPTRLERARAEIRTLAGHVRGDRLALVAFAGEARRMVPLTSDAATFAELVQLADPLAVSRGGTDLGAAIAVAADALPEPGGRRGFVILVTDGEDLEERGRAAALAAAARGVTVHCAGIGSVRGAKIPLEEQSGARFLRDRDGHDVVSAMDPDSLARIAAATGGAFVDGGAGEGVLRDLYDDHVLFAAPGAPVAADASRAGGRENRFQWPLVLGFLLLVIELGTSDRRRR